MSNNSQCYTFLIFKLISMLRDNDLNSVQLSQLLNILLSIYFLYMRNILDPLFLQFSRNLLE